MFKLWERIDEKVTFILGIVLTVGAFIGVAKFTLWLQQYIDSSRILRFFFGWLF